MPSNSLFSSPFNYYDTVMEHESESHFTAVPTIDVIKQIATLTSREPVHNSNADAISILQMYERDLKGYKQTLVNIVETVEACEGSELDVLVSLGSDLDDAAQAFSEIGQALCNTRKRFGHARSKESLESIHHDLLQRLTNARSLLKDRYDHLSQVKVKNLALGETRQN